MFSLQTFDMSSHTSFSDHLLVSRVRIMTLIKHSSKLHSFP